MRDGPVDLSPLDPEGDRVRHEERVRAILDAAAPQLARRAAGASFAVVRLARPVLAAAAVIIALATATLVAVPRSARESASSDGVAAALGVPTTVAAWTESPALPTPSGLLENSEWTR